MDKFTVHSGSTVAIYQPNIDTDQIIPKQFLKRIERTGYGEFLFYDWRFNSDGSAKREFILNDPRYKNASILIAGANFGCGSSREHAPWSLIDYGFRAVIAPGFADIFYNNSFKNGLLPIAISEDLVEPIARRSADDIEYTLAIDLETRTIADDGGVICTFEVDDFRRHCMLNGLDDIGLTLRHEAAIDEYETALSLAMPFLAY